MATNKNGWLELNLGTYEDRISGAMVGLLPSPLTTLVLQIPLRVSVSLGFFDNLGFNQDIIFYEEIRKMTEPNLGEVISRNAIANQPVVVFTGSFFEITLDDTNNPLNPHLFFFTAQDPVGFQSVYNRTNSIIGANYTLSVGLTFVAPLPVGNYQGDFIVTDSGVPVGRIIIHLTIVDADRMFEGPATTVWYHEI